MIFFLLFRDFFSKVEAGEISCGAGRGGGGGRIVFENGVGDWADRHDERPTEKVSSAAGV